MKTPTATCITLALSAMSHMPPTRKLLKDSYALEDQARRLFADATSAEARDEVSVVWERAIKSSDRIAAALSRMAR